MVLYLPCELEQKAIVEILSAADHEIDLLQKSIEAEKQKEESIDAAVIDLTHEGKQDGKCFRKHEF